MGAYSQLTGLIEGDYVETLEGFLFAVKGLHHPERLVIAYLRYIPDVNGDREGNSRRYRRIYDLDETDEFLRKRYPQYLNKIGSKGITLQSVPLDRVSRVFSPREHLRNLIDTPKSKLEKAVVRFVYALASESGVPLDDFGVSGSILIGLTGPLSDIDLIVYGVDNGCMVYDALLRLRESQEWIRSYDNETVKGVVRSRWGDTGLDMERLCDIEAGKVLHGLVEDRDYFVRLVRKHEEFEREVSSRPLGKFTLNATVVDAKQSIFTPCMYRVEDCSYLALAQMPEVSELVSYRGKFTEQVGEGDLVEAQGTIEEVVYLDRTVYRMMLGGRGDYLVPMHILDR
jgi:predicted nucleotidyltransferase